MMYADRENRRHEVRGSVRTYRRRAIQVAYNTEAQHHAPPTIKRRAIFDMNPASGPNGLLRRAEDRRARQARGAGKERAELKNTKCSKRIEAVRQEMFAAAESLQFRDPRARLRDELKRLARAWPATPISRFHAAAPDRVPDRPSRHDPKSRLPRHRAKRPLVPSARCPARGLRGAASSGRCR